MQAKTKNILLVRYIFFKFLDNGVFWMAKVY